MASEWSGNPSTAESATSGSSPNASSSKERGAALIEMALALPILVMLLVGMVSAGIAYNHQLALTHAAREGGRYGATLPVTNFVSLDAWLDEVSSQTIADGTGTLDPGVPGRYVCVAYVYPDGTTAGLPNDRTRNKTFSGGSASYGNAECFTDGRPPSERRVQVLVGRDTEFSAVFFSSTVSLDSEAVNRFEAAQ